MESNERQEPSREQEPEQEPDGAVDPDAADDRADRPEGEPVADAAGSSQGEQPERNVRWRHVTKTILVQGGVLAAVLGALVAGVFTLHSSNDGESSDDPKHVIVTSPKPEPPKGEPLRVVDVRPIPRRDGDASWLHPSPVDAAALDQFQLDSYGADPFRSEGADVAMRRGGAIPATVSTVELELEGNSERTVRITHVRAEIVKCRPPLNQTLFYAPPQGAVDVVGLGFDLDSSDPYAQYVKPRDGRPPRFTGDYFAKKKYRLERYEQVTFRFTARTFEQDCSFRYQFDLTVNGERTTQIVDNDGEPFRVSALIREGEDPLAAVDCAAYQHRYMASYMASGDVAELKPWVPAVVERC